MLSFLLWLIFGILIVSFGGVILVVFLGALAVSLMGYWVNVLTGNNKD